MNDAWVPKSETVYTGLTLAGWLDPTAAEALRTELSNTRQERDEARDLAVLFRDMAAERDAMLPVVEACKAFCFALPDYVYRTETLKALFAAVDALSTPPPGEGE